jgi:hypothetical protein
MNTLLARIVSRSGRARPEPSESFKAVAWIGAALLVTPIPLGHIASLVVSLAPRDEASDWHRRVSSAIQGWLDKHVADLSY